jgi:hypothetical protein
MGRFARLMQRRGRAFWRTCGPRRLRRRSQAALVATQGGQAGAGHGRSPPSASRCGSGQAPRVSQPSRYHSCWRRPCLTEPVRCGPNRGRYWCEQRETHAHRRGDHHGIPPSPNRGRRLRLAVAGAAVLTALTVTSAGATPPTPMRVAAPRGVGASGLTRLGTMTRIISASTPSNTRPRTPLPGFLLDRGRTIKFDAPKASTETGPSSINDRA